MKNGAFGSKTEKTGGLTLISEEKINELIEKEIKDQVAAKLKQVGRQTISDAYKSVIQKEVNNHLQEIKNETVKELEAMVAVEKDYWKKEVMESIKEKFSNKIDYVFDNQDRDYY